MRSKTVHRKTGRIRAEKRVSEFIAFPLPSSLTDLRRGEEAIPTTGSRLQDDVTLS